MLHTSRAALPVRVCRLLHDMAPWPEFPSLLKDFPPFWVSLDEDQAPQQGLEAREDSSRSKDYGGNQRTRSRSRR